MKQSGEKYSLSESTIANRKCQKTTGFTSFSERRKILANEKYQKTTGFISFLAHRKIIANQKCQKTPGFISFLEHVQSKMSKNDRFYKLSGTLQTKPVKKRQVL